MFKTEILLLQKFIESSSFITDFAEDYVLDFEGTELKGLFGVPDYFLAFSRVANGTAETKMFAFEFKLSNWKRALAQAFKYQSFSDYSFVVMDAAFVKRALNYFDRFVGANIGLASVDDLGHVTCHFFPLPTKSTLQFLRPKVNSIISKQKTSLTVDLMVNDKVEHVTFCGGRPFYPSMSRVADSTLPMR